MAAIGTSFANYNENKRASEQHQRKPMHKNDPDLSNNKLMDNSTLSPNKVKATVKTTKSTAGHPTMTKKHER